jgi:hypothetical protein
VPGSKRGRLVKEKQFRVAIAPHVPMPAAEYPSGDGRLAEDPRV